MEKEKLKTFDSNQTILPLTVGFDSPMDAEAIICHFTATIFAIRVGCKNRMLSNEKLRYQISILVFGKKV